MLTYLCNRISQISRWCHLHLRWSYLCTVARRARCARRFFLFCFYFILFLFFFNKWNKLTNVIATRKVLFVNRGARRGPQLFVELDVSCFGKTPRRVIFCFGLFFVFVVLGFFLQVGIAARTETFLKRQVFWSGREETFPHYLALTSWSLHCWSLMTVSFLSKMDFCFDGWLDRAAAAESVLKKKKVLVYGCRIGLSVVVKHADLRSRCASVLLMSRCFDSSGILTGTPRPLPFRAFPPAKLHPIRRLDAVNIPSFFFFFVLFGFVSWSRQLCCQSNACY